MADIAHSGCLILWGYNPSMSRLTHATATVEARKRGMKLIVIDPRNAGFAHKADIWLRVRPGTDGALALGLMHELIANDWFQTYYPHYGDVAVLDPDNDLIPCESLAGAA